MKNLKMSNQNLAPRISHITKAITASVFATILLGALSPAMAQDNTQEAKGWSFELTPYLWATRMNGSAQAGRLPKTDVDMKFSDILENLDFGLMSAFEARKDRWGFMFDGMYMKLSDAATASIGNGSITAGANVRIQQSMLSAATAYRISEGLTAVDLIGGLRYNKIDVDADIDGSLFGLSGTVKRSGKKNWTDPYIGLRVIHPISEAWSATGYVDVGGFGIGADSTWQGLAGLTYAYSKTISLNVGYRYMKIDYKDGGFRYDMANDGLYAGAGIRF